MNKIARSFRLEEITLDRLEKLADHYALIPGEQYIPGQKTKVTKTDIVEFLINKAFKEIEEKEEEEWAKRNINKLV